ncbi:MAG: hypothetical protein ONB23_11750 [candidate division KSB1 bacterium]|nr:hypothetical protein [candidate division KSB1 bacterium]
MRPRQFAYRPRFYAPPPEEGEEHRLRFETRFFSRERSIHRQRKSLLVLIILLVIVVYLFYYFQRLAQQDRRASGPIKVEDIEVIEVPAPVE